MTSERVSRCRRRIVRCAGPSVFDRAVALETLTLVMVAALLLHDYLAVDAALGLALFAFIGTVMLGRFLGQGDKRAAELLQ